jgi:methylmalonic aciduria homocystinuria type C protein
VNDDALARLADRGFDIAHAFDAHAAACEPGWERLAAGPRVGILIANTRALWAPFCAARTDEPDPLDRYTERAVAEAFPEAPVVVAHRAYGGAFLPFGRLAHAVGLGALAPSRLVIHPIHGPWIALRAVIAIEGTPPVHAPIAKPCTCGEPCRAALAAALPTTDWRAWLAVRDACTLRADRYGEDQIHFHYSQAWSRRSPG